MIRVKFPTVFTPVTGGKRKVEVQAGSVKELLDRLFEEFPGLREKLLRDGELTPFINIFVNGEDIRYLNGIDTELKDGDEVAFIPAISGG
ncbi:ubiquitin-like small modifier protein 1 [Geoglobus sp.]